MKKLKIIIVTLILFMTSLTVKSQTTFLDILKDILVESQVTFKNIGSTSFVVNSATNARLFGGETRVAVKVNLPIGTIRWFYRVTVLEKESTYSYQQNESLYYIIKNKGNDYYYNPTRYGVDIYLLGHSGDVASFTQTGNDNFNCFTNYTKLNTGTTYGSIKDIVQENQNLWLGIKNPNATTGLKVIVEIVAQGRYN